MGDRRPNDNGRRPGLRENLTPQIRRFTLAVSPVSALVIAKYFAIGGVQCVHDLCVVRTSQELGDGTVVCRRVRQLGDCACRIPASSSCKSNRVPAGRFQCGAAQDFARGHHAGGVRPVCFDLHGGTLEAGLSLGGVVLGGCCLFCVSQRLNHQ